MRYKMNGSKAKAAIVERLSASDIAYWQIAEVLGCHENTVSKMMRNPNDEQAARINAAIDAIECNKQA